MDSKLGHNPSFVWHNIFSAKMVIRQVTHWKIGYGFTVPIVGEPWMGTGSSIPPVGPEMLALQPYLLGHLIDKSTKFWNEQLILHLFATETTQNILNTPLHQQVDMDGLVWTADKNGLYYVRISYRICIEDIINNNYLWKPECYNGMWKLKVPPKVRNLMW